MYSIYAPGKTALNVADAGQAAVLLGTPQVQDYVASTVQADAYRRGYIVSRTQDVNRPDLTDIAITLVDHSGDLAGDLSALSNIRDIVATWARRSRVRGVSGDRVAVVGPVEQVLVNGVVDTFSIQLRLGTAVFFNDRRVTVNFAADNSEFQQDLVNLLDHLRNHGFIGDLAGVIIDHDEFGIIHSGNTDQTINASVTDDVDAIDALSDAELQEAINSIRMSAATFDLLDRHALMAQLRDISDEVQGLLETLGD